MRATASLIMIERGCLAPYLFFRHIDICLFVFSQLGADRQPVFNSRHLKTFPIRNSICKYTNTDTVVTTIDTHGGTLVRSDECRQFLCFSVKLVISCKRGQPVQVGAHAVCELSGGSHLKCVMMLPSCVPPQNTTGWSRGAREWGLTEGTSAQTDESRIVIYLESDLVN